MPPLPWQYLVGAAVVVAVARLVAYAIDNRERWRRFLFLVLLALAVVAGWWLLADGGVQVLLHDFGGVPPGAGSVSTR